MKKSCLRPWSRLALAALAPALLLASGCSQGESDAPAEETSIETAAEAPEDGEAPADVAPADEAAPADVAPADEEAPADEAPAGGEDASPDYSLPENWAYLETDVTDRSADVFFICPTVYGGSEDAGNMSLDDEETKESFLGATNMEKGIYDGDARFFAPYYRQIGLSVYELPEEEREPYLDIALADVEDAFEYYWENINKGQPLILAGFSQGADLCIRLIKDCFDQEMADQLIACYAIGWRVTDEDLADSPFLRMAAGETDTGVVISFNSEAESITDSLTIPAGVKTHAINPLNWKTDGTPADKSLNLGACFTDYSGAVEAEIPALTGAYIDETRGALKVPDVSPEDYPAGLSIFTDGIYHLYDYQFFYRNLQENVQARTAAWLSARG